VNPQCHMTNIMTKRKRSKRKMKKKMRRMFLQILQAISQTLIQVWICRNSFRTNPSWKLVNKDLRNCSKRERMEKIWAWPSLIASSSKYSKKEEQQEATPNNSLTTRVLPGTKKANLETFSETREWVSQECWITLSTNRHLPGNERGEQNIEFCNFN